LTAFLARCWYHGARAAWLFLPFSWLYGTVIFLRRQAYRLGLLRRHRLPVPVIVVGNLTVGGSGKTPLVIWLVEVLRQAGWRPGVISRGYGGSQRAVSPVRGDSHPERVGDEPVLIARRCACPVWVGARRVEAAEALLSFHPEVDVLISDDGLQHLALQRDVEIVVVDGERGYGNQWLLPAGPLREPMRRLRSVTAEVVNGGSGSSPMGTPPRFRMKLVGDRFWKLRDPAQSCPASAFLPKTVRAVAGIGNPGRFMAHLRGLGLDVEGTAFPDHHRFQPGDLPPGTVLMTEKDAVKCAAWAPEDAWALRIDAQLEDGLQSLIMDHLKAHHGRQAA